MHKHLRSLKRKIGKRMTTPQILIIMKKQNQRRKDYQRKEITHQLEKFEQLRERAYQIKELSHLKKK